jgi:hypothetical protein
MKSPLQSRQRFNERIWNSTRLIDVDNDLKLSYVRAADRRVQKGYLSETGWMLYLTGLD